MSGLIGRKVGMTQIFNEQGQQIPVTVISAQPNRVLGVVDKAKSGYAAVQLGMAGEPQPVARPADAKNKRVPRGRRATRAELGHAKQAGLDAPPKVVRSVRLDSKGNAKLEIPSFKLGDTVGVDIFTVGETVKVSGTSKGRGFQGIVKRHGAGGGPNTHGNTKHRRPGSVGPGTDPSRVIKGKRMPGHYGAERHTQTHLRVEKVDAERHLIYVRGSVAGPMNGIVVVRKQVGNG